MSGNTRLFREYVARERFVRNLQLLELELSMGSPRRYVAVLVELLELLVEQTGGSSLTVGYRRQLADAKRRAETHTNLRLLQ